MRIKSYNEFVKIVENSNTIHKYGCAMAYFNFPKMAELHTAISENDIYTDPTDDSYGLETTPHTTLLYGLHDTVGDEEVLNICKKYPIGQMILHNPSLFSNDKYDVLKFDVDNGDLHNINSELSKLPHTTDFPDYHPHTTIAYLKPGTGKQYVDKLQGHKYIVVPHKFVYSKTNGTKIERPIINNNTYGEPNVIPLT